MNQICTLRGHLNSISCIAQFNDSIVTGDDNGWIIWWNLNRRCPLGVWKGHDMVILTIKQIDDNYILTQSKDSEIRIWKLEGGLKSDLPDLKFNDIKYNDDLTELLEKYPMPEYNSIPINSLNYCNVDYLNGVLITPATTDSNNFDIYRVSHQDFGLERLVKNFNPHELYLKSNNIIEEIGNDKRDGFGIMMKIKFINDNYFYIGFESGHVLGFTINYPSAIESAKQSNKVSEKLIINREPKITIDYVNEFHVPNPIISMESFEDGIIVGATQKYVSLHPLGKTINVKNNGIQSIVIKDKAYIGFWNGTVKVYDDQFIQIHKFERSLPNLHNVTTNINSNELEVSTIKLSTLQLFQPTPKNTTSSKSLVLNKRMGSNQLLIIGYNDGKLLVFS